MENEERKPITVKEFKFDELMSCVYLTVLGKRTIRQLIKEVGRPKVVLNYAKVEALTGMVARSTIPVERFISGELFFRSDIVIPNVSRQLLMMVDYAAIEKVYIRHPSYDSKTLVKATEKEKTALITQ